MLDRAVTDVINERNRQVLSLGYLETDDDEGDGGDLAAAGAAYALNASCQLNPASQQPLDALPVFWMWDHVDWKPKDARRDLVRAAALILAEIERIDRAAKRAAA